MPILKRQVYSSANSVSLFILIKDYFYVFFSSNNIYFAQKEPIKMKIFETFECSCQILANSLYRFRNDKLIPLQIFYPSSLHQRLFLCSFLAQRIYTLLNRSPLKWKFFIVSSARVKFCLIPYANSKVTS